MRRSWDRRGVRRVRNGCCLIERTIGGRMCAYSLVAGVSLPFAKAPARSPRPSSTTSPAHFCPPMGASRGDPAQWHPACAPFIGRKPTGRLCCMSRVASMLADVNADRLCCTLPWLDPPSTCPAGTHTSSGCGILATCTLPSIAHVRSFSPTHGRPCFGVALLSRQLEK